MYSCHVIHCVTFCLVSLVFISSAPCLSSSTVSFRPLRDKVCYRLNISILKPPLQCKARCYCPNVTFACHWSAPLPLGSAGYCQHQHRAVWWEKLTVSSPLYIIRTKFVCGFKIFLRSPSSFRISFLSFLCLMFLYPFFNIFDAPVNSGINNAYCHVLVLLHFLLNCPSKISLKFLIFFQKTKFLCLDWPSFLC